jgi:prevent-host-death family protein
MGTSRIGIRQLREDLSQAIRRVRRGHVLEVTDHGHPVARIVPVAPIASGLAQPIAEGKLRPARTREPLPRPLAIRGRMSSEKALEILRGD